MNLLESLLCPSALRIICPNGFISPRSWDFKTTPYHVAEGLFKGSSRARIGCPVALWPSEGFSLCPRTGHLQQIGSTLNSRFRAQGDIWGQWPDRAWAPPSGKEGRLVSLPSETAGAWLVWRRWTSVRVCRRHLISLAWIQREKKCCQMGWNTWHSWLVKRGKRRPGLQKANWLEKRSQEEIFFYEYENHTIGQEPDTPTSLSMPCDHLSANLFLSFFKVEDIR